MRISGRDDKGGVGDEVGAGDCDVVVLLLAAVTVPNLACHTANNHKVTVHQSGRHQDAWCLVGGEPLAR